MTQERDDRIYDWWRRAIADRNSGNARALAARLRRAEGVEVLAEREVHELAQLLRVTSSDATRLIRLVQVLAEVREQDSAPLARRLGGTELTMSNLRFERLLRSRGDEFTLAVRRALMMVDRRCNVRRLASDLLQWDHPEWGDAVRTEWSFDYFAIPRSSPSPADQQPLEESL